MADRKAMVRIGSKPDSSLRRTLRGVVDATQKVTQQISGSARKRADAERKASAVVQGSLRQVAAEAERSAMRRLNAARRVANGKIRESKRSTESEIRDYRRVTRERARENRRVSGGGRGVAIGGAAVGFYTGARGAVSSAQQTLGVGTQESRLLAAKDFKTLLLTKGIESGKSEAEIAQVQDRVMQIAKDTLTEPIELIRGLATGQTRFDAFEQFLDSLGDLSKFNRSTQSEMQDTIGMIGTIGDIFGIKGKESADALYYMAASAARGTISVKDFGGSLASVLGEIRAATGRKGMEGLRETVALLQMVGKGQAGAERTGTYAKGLMAQLNETTVQRKLKKLGIEVTEKGKIGGTLLGMDEIMKRFVENKKIQSAAVQQKVFTLREARAGLNFFINAIKENPESLANIQGATVESGRELVEKQFKALTSGSMGRMEEVRVLANIKAIESMDKVADMNYFLANEITKLQTEFPILAKALDVLENSITGLAGGLLAGRFLAGRMGGAAAGGAVTTTVSGAAATSPVAAIVGPIAVGIATFTITSAVLKIFGLDKGLENLGAAIYEWLHPKDSIDKTNKRGLVPVSNRPIEHMPQSTIDKLNRTKANAKELKERYERKREEEAKTKTFTIDWHRDPNAPLKLDFETTERIGTAVGKNISRSQSDYMDTGKRPANSPAR